GPTTSSSGTNTSSKKISLKSEFPDGIFSGRTVTPGACMSITIVVMPRCLGASGLVRTVARPKLASRAPLVQTFWPLIRHPPSVLVALVLMPAAADQAGDLDRGLLGVYHRGDRRGPAQVQVRVVLPGEADPAVHLDVEVGVADRGRHRQRGRDGRGVAELVTAAGSGPARVPRGA